MWFYHQILPRLSTCHHPIPKPIAIEYGHSLAALYFEYIPKPRPFYAALVGKLRFSRMMKQYSLVEYAFSEIEDPQGEAKLEHAGFITNPYRRGRNCAKKLLIDWSYQNPSLDTMETAIIDLPAPYWRFSHGDLSTENFYANCLVDFDNCGWYPLGFDLAMMLSLVQRFSDVESLLRFASNRSSIPLLDPAARFSFLYFCFIFYSRRVREINASDAFLQSLWRALLQLREKILVLEQEAR